MQTQEPLTSTFLSKPLASLCAVSALFGGTVLVGLALMVCGFLPWCHLKGGNMFVDFVTARASTRAQRYLDAFAGLLVATMMALVAWRAGAGALAAKASGETTMIRGFPLWVSYLLMTPGLALTSLVALDIAWRRWKEAAGE